VDVARKTGCVGTAVTDEVIAKAAKGPGARTPGVLDHMAAAMLAGDRGSLHSLAFADLFGVEPKAAGDVWRDTGAGTVIDQQPAFTSFL
jgi:hypothetical protein